MEHPDAIGYVDTHVHFWDHAVDGLSWAWLDPTFEHPRIRGLHAYDAPRYAAPEFRAEAQGAGVSKIVHVQAASWGPHPERETAWLQAHGDEHGWPDAIVGSVQLGAEDTPALLEKHAVHPRYRGVRDLSVAGRLEDPRVVRHLGAVAATGGVFELMVAYEHFPAAAAAARANPELMVVVEHAGLPVERTAEYLHRWEQALRELADVPSTVCKISGLAGAVDPDWTIGSLRPWVEGCLEAFGVERCMFGSNWPVDKPYGTYTGLVAAYRELIRDLSPREQERVLRGTAQAVYRV